MKRRPRSAAAALGDLVTDAALDYVKTQHMQQAPDACPCLACRVGNLLGSVSRQVQHARGNPGEAMKQFGQQFAAGLETAAQRRASIDPPASSVAEAIKTARHAAQQLQRIREDFQRLQPRPILRRGPDGVYRP